MKFIFFRKKNKTGFTLLEIIIYTAILTIALGLFAGILNVSTRVQVRESSSTELSTQLNFVIQTIQRLVRESSATIVNNPLSSCGNDSGDTDGNESTAGYRCLKLRMSDDARDPTLIWGDIDGKIKIKQGSDPAEEFTSLRAKCVYTSSLPNHCLLFKKYSGYIGNDIIEISLSLTNTQQILPVSRKVKTSISRANAAAFDSDLIPVVDESYSLGSENANWKNLFISGTFKEPGNYNAGDRGLKLIGWTGTQICGNMQAPASPTTGICYEHGMKCYGNLKFDVMAGTFSPVDCNNAAAQADSGFCSCANPLDPPP